jgi:ribulose-5-phosphate 4-epimerase/fuculose-1-phosphate aldolase
MTASPASNLESELLRDLVDANHILFNEKVVDAFGHVSVRHHVRHDHFLLARNIAPATVAAEDIIEFDLNGASVSGDKRRTYLERFIHSEIYRARPDVMAIVHSHSPSVVSFSLVKGFRFRPACHMCGFLGKGAEIFDIRDVGGFDTDLLIRNHHLGQALASSLGSSNAVLMRGHGSTVVAPSLKQAVYRAVYIEVNAKILADALRIGSVEYLSVQEAHAALAIEEQIERPWQLWRAAARSARSLRES